MHSNQERWITGPDGTESFRVRAIGESINDEAGVYIACFKGSNGWCPLWITQAESLAQSKLHQRQLKLAAAKGASHLHFLPIQNRFERHAVEQAMLTQLQPPMNQF